MECNDCKNQKECKAKVLDSQTFVEGETTHLSPMPDAKNALAKIPVVLSESEVEVDVESTIEFGEPVLEIKRIKKNVYLTQCKLIPYFVKEYGRLTGKVFLKGFVRKNIEYATKKCFGYKSISGDIHHLTVNIPFETVAKIELDEMPIIKDTEEPIIIEFGLPYQCEKACSPTLIGDIPCEEYFEFKENFNEPFFCEIEKAKVIEIDMHNDMDSIKGFPVERTFSCLTEKMMVLIRFKVLQRQQVVVGQDYFPCKE